MRTYEHAQDWRSYMAVNEVERHNFPFYALIVCAMKHADTDNLNRLRFAFPGLFEDAQERYNNPLKMNNAELKEQNKKPISERMTSDRFYKILKQIEEEFK